MVLSEYNEIKVGGTDIAAIYAGDTRVWAKDIGPDTSMRVLRFTTTDGNIWDKKYLSAYTADDRMIEPIENTATGWTYGEDVAYLDSNYGYSKGNLLAFEGFRKKVKIKSCSQLFYHENVTSINLRSLDTSVCTNMAGMFQGCGKLTALDLSMLNTSQVKNMGMMFLDCPSLTTINLSNLDTSKNTTMTGMFSGCRALETIDVSMFNTSQVTQMGAMFQGCESLTTLDASNWNVSKVTKMRGMFKGCTSLTTLDFSNWKLLENIDVVEMFSGCTALRAINMLNCDEATIAIIKGAIKAAGLDGQVEITAKGHYVYNERNEMVSFDTGIKTYTNTKFRVVGKLRGRMTGDYYVGHQGDTDADDFRLFMPFDDLCWMYDCGENRMHPVFSPTKDGDEFDITCGNNYVLNNLTGENVTQAEQSNISAHTIKLNLGFAYTGSLQIWQGDELVYDVYVSGGNKLIDRITGNEITDDNFQFI